MVTRSGQERGRRGRRGKEGRRERGRKRERRGGSEKRKREGRYLEKRENIEKCVVFARQHRIQKEEIGEKEGRRESNVIPTAY